MTFTTFHFVAFFFVTIFLGHLLKGRWQRIFLLFASYYFYGVYEPSYLWLILASSVYDYIAALGIEARRARKAGGMLRGFGSYLGLVGERFWLSFSLLLNLSLLAYFKYTNFGIEVLNDLSYYGDTSFSWPMEHILLPIGISFYTFQSLSYTIDVYRGDLRARENIVDFFLYVAFFPQLVAGPIVRASTFFRDLDKRLPIHTEDVVIGFSRIVVGFFRKLVVADNLGLLVNQGFARYQTLTPAEVWLVAWAFGYQIYFDFAGYTDIARGVARLFGFEFDMNFNYPLAAKNIKEHWQRWHISLTTWIRDYVYIPLGGSRVSRPRFYFNLFVIWFLTGVWHGPSYHFIAWGVLQGLLIVGHMQYAKTPLAVYLNGLGESPSFTQKSMFRIYAWASWAVLLFFLFFGFIYFRAPNMHIAHCMIFRAFGLADAGVFFNEIFSSLLSSKMFLKVPWDLTWKISACLPPGSPAAVPVASQFSEFWPLLVLVMAYEHLAARYNLDYFWRPENKQKLIVYLSLMILCVIVFALPEASGFIYFAF